MRQEDYILREIQKISILLMGLLGKLIQHDELGNIEKEWRELQDVTHLSLDDLLRVEPLEMVKALIRNNGFNTNNLEIFAQSLYEMRYLYTDNQKEMLLKRALFILEYIEVEEKTYSFDRQNLILKIKNA